MTTFFNNTNKNSVQLDILHGWDGNAKAWYIDIKMTGFSGSNIRELFTSEKNYKKTLKNFLV